MKNFVLLTVAAFACACGCGPDTSVTLPDKPHTEPVPVATEDANGGSNAQTNTLKPRK